MVLSYSVCCVSVAPVRSEPSHRAEQVTQLLFGERAEIVEIDNNGWARIISEWDEYIGWVKESQLFLFGYGSYKKTLHHISTSWRDQVQTPDGRFLLSPGSSLFQLRKKTFLWNENWLYKGSKIKLKSSKPSKQHLRQFVQLFYGSPYSWGGRSILGIDCSGLSQVVYKMMNIRLPRDAYQQAEYGETVSFLQEAQCGDLAFFDNDAGRITHIGILLDHQTIIHATETAGSVVIDMIDNGGIISKNLRKRTHNLRIIKRITDLK